jgi:hypothetical protein
MELIAIYEEHCFQLHGRFAHGASGCMGFGLPLNAACANECSLSASGDSNAICQGSPRSPHGDDRRPETSVNVRDLPRDELGYKNVRIVLPLNACPVRGDATVADGILDRLVHTLIGSRCGAKEPRKGCA